MGYLLSGAYLGAARVKRGGEFLPTNTVCHVILAVIKPLVCGRAFRGRETGWRSYSFFL
jgi:hypothetical protein